MKVLQLDSGPTMRGGQWQALYLIEALRDRGFDVRLLAQERSPLFQRVAAAGIRVETLGWRAISRLRDWPDLVHCHDARSHTLAAAFAKAPIVVSRRVAFPIRAGLLSRWKYGRARRYIAVSRFVAQRLIDAGIKSGAISVVYDGVALPATTAAAAGTRIVAPATEDPMKGSELLRRAATLSDVVPQFSDNLPNDLPGASLFVYITREEGLGSAALLAMAGGVPVVASRVGGLTEVVDHERTGLLVENRPEAIAEAIRTLMNEPSRAAAMGEAGRERVRDLFTIDKMVDETVEVYRKVVG